MHILSDIIRTHICFGDIQKHSGFHTQFQGKL
jgi:hypothetical protein